MAGVLVTEYTNTVTGQVQFKFRGQVGCYFLEGTLHRAEGNTVKLKAKDVLFGHDVEDELVVFNDEIIGDKFYLKLGKNRSTWLNLKMAESEETESRGLWK